MEAADPENPNFLTFVKKAADLCAKLKTTTQQAPAIALVDVGGGVIRLGWPQQDELSALTDRLCAETLLTFKEAEIAARAVLASRKVKPSASPNLTTVQEAAMWEFNRRNNLLPPWELTRGGHGDDHDPLER